MPQKESKSHEEQPEVVYVKHQQHLWTKTVDMQRTRAGAAAAAARELWRKFHLAFIFIDEEQVLVRDPEVDPKSWSHNDVFGTIEQTLNGLRSRMPACSSIDALLALVWSGFPRR